LDISEGFNVTRGIYKVEFRSEAELVKKPPVLATLELLLQQSFSLLVSLLALGAVIRTLRGHHVLEIHFQGVTRRHHVLIVHHLNERLNARAAGLGLLG